MTANKVACVTGSGKQRVGWFVADALARQGYSIAVHYRLSAAEACEAVKHFTSHGAPAAAFAADLTDEAAVKSLFQQVWDRFGRLDVLVHCAAIWWPTPLEDTTAKDVQLFFDTNALSTFLCSQQAGLRMADQPEGGCIIHIGDWATERPYLDHAAYFVSKGSIPALTRVMAIELAFRNPRVRVNCILPGPVMFPPDLPAEEKKRAIDATLVQHEGRPENVAQAVLALVQNEFITGVCLPVDGGRTIYPVDSGRQRTAP